MASARVELIPWLSERLGARAGEHLVLEEGLVSGETLRQFVIRLIDGHPAMGQVLSEGVAGELPEGITVVLNGRLLDLVPDRLDVVLRDGDRITFLASFAGG